MRQKTGVVVSDRMNKTIVVKVERFKAHPKYHKKYRVSTKYYAHDEHTEARMGDKVTIQETRPLSKLKRWTLVKIEAKGSKLTEVKV